jgi:hypothetical protein
VDIRHLIDATLIPWGMMMTPTRRAGDDEDAQSKAMALVKPLMMPVFTAALAVVGVSAGPVEKLHGTVDAIGEKIVTATNKLTQVETEVYSLREKVNEISARRTLQVAELEKRILACELTIAERHGAPRK